MKNPFIQMGFRSDELFPTQDVCGNRNCTN